MYMYNAIHYFNSFILKILTNNLSEVLLPASLKNPFVTYSPNEFLFKVKLTKSIELHELLLYSLFYCINHIM